MFLRGEVGGGGRGVDTLMHTMVIIYKIIIGTCKLLQAHFFKSNLLYLQMLDFVFVRNN